MGTTPVVALVSFVFAAMIFPAIHVVIVGVASPSGGGKAASPAVSGQQRAPILAHATLPPSKAMPFVAIANDSRSLTLGSSREIQIVDLDSLSQIAQVDGKPNSMQVAPSKTQKDIDSQFKDEADLWKELKAARCARDWTPAVKHELANWSEKGFTLQDVRYYCAKRVFRLSFVNNEMRVARYGVDRKNIHRLICGHWLIYMAIQRAAAMGNPIPPFELNVQPGDAAFTTGRIQWKDAAPLLSNIKCGGASVSFPLTIHDQFGTGFGTMSMTMYKERYDTMLSWEEPPAMPPWLDKTPQAFFSAPRGSKLRGNRSALFELTSPALHVTEESTDIREMAAYQGNIYAYGHCGWSRRIHELAMMNTVVFMEHSACREYFHAMFEPDVDHVPVAEDFSDLPTKLESLKDLKKAEEMAAKWFEKGKELFSLACVLDYVDALLREYAKLQKFEPPYHPTWPQYFPNETHAFFTSNETELPKNTCEEPVMFKAKKSHKC